MREREKGEGRREKERGWLAWLEARGLRLEGYAECGRPAKPC
jgi:hypothetical protein